MFTGRSDVEAEIPILWPPDEKSWLIWKDPDAGKDWGQEEKGTTEDEMVGWHHRFDGHGFGWTLGVGDGQEGLACCGSWGRKELDTTERLNWTELIKDNRQNLLTEHIFQIWKMTKECFPQLSFFLPFFEVCVFSSLLCLFFVFWFSFNLCSVLLTFHFLFLVQAGWNASSSYRIQNVYQKGSHNSSKNRLN